MSEENTFSLSVVKRCVICNDETCIEGEGVRCSNNSSCPFVLTGNDCMSALENYARNGSMKYCYQCGGEMARGEDFIVCDNCADSELFSTMDTVTVEEVKRCMLCSNKLNRAGVKLFCSNKRKCNFRLAAKDDQTVTESLHQCARNGNVKFCYSCGAHTINASDYTACSKEDCMSVKLPAKDNDPKHQQECAKDVESTMLTQKRANFQSKEVPVKCALPQHCDAIQTQKLPETKEYIGGSGKVHSKKGIVKYRLSLSAPIKKKSNITVMEKRMFKRTRLTHFSLGRKEGAYNIIDVHV